MASLLRIDSSSRTEGSHSRKLADVIEQAWQQKHIGAAIVYRDLAHSPVPHIANETIAGFYSEPGQYDAAIKSAMKSSDELIEELLAVDEVLISVPMYNFTIPSVLKAWIDQIVRPGYAFTITEEGEVKALINGKKIYIAMSYGFEYTGTDYGPYDFVKPYLGAILGYIGMTDLHFIAVEGTAVMDESQLGDKQAIVFEQARALV